MLSWWLLNSCQSVSSILWINCSLKLPHFAALEESLFHSLWSCCDSAMMDFECDSVTLSKYMKKIWYLVLWSATYKSKNTIWHITSQIIVKDICQLRQAQNDFGKQLTNPWSLRAECAPAMPFRQIQNCLQNDCLFTSALFFWGYNLFLSLD